MRRARIFRTESFRLTALLAALFIASSLVLTTAMFLAAENLQFEKAARLRDELKKLQGGEAAGASSSNGTPARPSKRGAAELQAWQ